MRKFRCQCGNTVFFENTRCLNCRLELGWCPACEGIASIVPLGGDRYRCGNLECSREVRKCFNYAAYAVCNRCVLAEESSPEALCDCCRFNDTIPDLTVPGNLELWARLEAAKRRLFYDLRLLGLPVGNTHDGVEPPLAFDFKADVIPANDYWRSVGKSEKVYTGHAAGRITINLREADDIERERLRIDFGEAHRTLIGHFRHEIGHYYWDVLVKDKREDECGAVFGDHNHPTYSEALERHYQQGPPADWPTRYVSAYATMHPWEDFAECWATYLDMVSVLDTAEHTDLDVAGDPLADSFDGRLARYQRLGLALNEVNRSMGLLDVVPEVFGPSIAAKLRWIDELIRSASQLPQSQPLVESANG